jgi:preprotein translocase subunit SecB
MAEDKKNQSKSTKAPTKPKKESVAAGKDQAENNASGLSIEKIFLGDVSVEVPNAPDIFTIHDAPLIDIELNNTAKPVSDGYFEVSLQVTVTAKQGEKTAFLVDITQAGIFLLNNVPEEGLEMVLAITCPNILFPYAREAISDLIVKAGFSSVLLNPINFESLYLKQKQEQASENSGQAN